MVVWHAGNEPSAVTAALSSTFQLSLAQVSKFRVSFREDHLFTQLYELVGLFFRVVPVWCSVDNELSNQNGRDVDGCGIAANHHSVLSACWLQAKRVRLQPIFRVHSLSNLCVTW